MQSLRTAAATLAVLLISLVSAVIVDESSEDRQDLRDTREPSKDLNDLLTRFMQEFVHVTPGLYPFSEMFSTGEDAHVSPTTFRIARYETTQELYQAVTENNPSRWKGPRNSVDSVTQLDAKNFCMRLTQILRQRGQIRSSQKIRLPTLAEWEYCCRAGSKTNWCFGDIAGEEDLQKLNEYAWHMDNAAGNDPAVGVLRPNQFGLFDMHGYLWEYVSTDSAATDGADAEPSGGGVPIAFAMGGSWRDHYHLLVSDSQISVPLYAASDAIGFRCVLADDNDAAGNAGKQ